MSWVGVGVVLALIGVLLYFTVAPGIGGALIIVGMIVALVGVLVDQRGRL